MSTRQAIIAFSVALMAVNAFSECRTVFCSDGSITRGDNKIIAGKDGQSAILLGNRKVFDLYQEFRLTNTSWISVASNSGQISNRKFIVDEKEKKSVYTCEITDEKGSGKLSFSQEIRLLDDGLVSVRTEYRPIPESGNNPVAWSTLLMSSPFDFFEGKTIKADDEEVRFSTSDMPREKDFKVLRYKKTGKLDLFSSDPAKNLIIAVNKSGAVYIRENRVSLPDGMSIGFRPLDDGVTEIILDLGKPADKSEEAGRDKHFNIDYWGMGKLHVPNFSYCRNILPNPSFESGLRYYQPGIWGGSVVGSEDDVLYKIDENEAVFGNNSLTTLGFKKFPHPNGIRTFLMPVEQNKKYTFSFYAKGDKKTGLQLHIISSSANVRDEVVFDSPRPPVGISAEWKRYSVSFTTPGRGINVLLRPRYEGDDPSGMGRIWVDGMQLEKGELTEYTEKPLHSLLKTSNQYNFFTKNDEIGASIKITAAPDTAGRYAVRMTDFFDDVLWQKSASFKTDDKGRAEITLDIDDKVQNGIMRVEADYELDNGYKESDFYRISVMDPLQGKHKLKNLCAASFPSYDHARQKQAYLYFWRSIGIGAVGSSESALLRKELGEYNIDIVNANLVSGVYGAKSDSVIRVNNEILFAGITKIQTGDITPEYLEKLDRAVGEKVRSAPDIKCWDYMGEPEGNLRNMKDMKELAGLYTTVSKSIKKADPNAKYCAPGTMNMMPRGGTAWLDRFYSEFDDPAGIFDVVAVHPYRQSPEAPDLDDDTVIFLDMLKKHGLDRKDVFWLEGIYHVPYIIPEYGLNAIETDIGYQDKHYGGTVSYHMGWGEKMCAAYYARSILVAMKYSDRIKYYNGWAKYIEQDLDMNLFALAKVYNTLGNILGNSVFKKDIRFAPGLRCYVFEDEKKRPVAALWAHIKDADRGEKNAPSISVPFGNRQKIEVFDLMENRMEANMGKDGTLTLASSPFPVFIRGKKNSTEKFCKALDLAFTTGQDAAFPLEISLDLQDLKNCVLNCRNPLSRSFEGVISLKTGNKPVAHNINIPGGGSVKLNAPLEEPLRYDALENIAFPLCLDYNGRRFAQDISLAAFAAKKKTPGRSIKIDGSLDDWDGIPEIKIINQIIAAVPPEFQLKYKERSPIGDEKDFSASFRITWDETNLYLAVKVTDDVFFHEKMGWANDSLQTYFDTMCDARKNLPRTGFDQNDYNYDFFPYENSLIAYRRFSADRQVSAYLEAEIVEKNIETSFRKTGDGYVYEIRFPVRYLMPLELKNGNVVGFSINVIDHDGEFVKRYLVLTPNGTGAYMKPHLCPAMLLTE